MLGYATSRHVVFGSPARLEIGRGYFGATMQGTHANLDRDCTNLAGDRCARAPASGARNDILRIGANGYLGSSFGLRTVGSHSAYDLAVIFFEQIRHPGLLRG